MKVSVILGHPCEASFNHAIAETVVRTLRAEGHTVWYHDLYDEGFDPVTTCAETPKGAPLDPFIQRHCDEIAEADGIVIVHPNWWGQLPAILKGWITRVFTYGFAYTLTAEGWQGAVNGRVSLLDLKKALIIQPTFFSEEDYESTGLKEAMRKTIDMWAFEYPGIPDVQHVYFHGMYGVDENTREGYLQRAYQLGKEF